MASFRRARRGMRSGVLTVQGASGGDNRPPRLEHRRVIARPVRDEKQCRSFGTDPGWPRMSRKGSYSRDGAAGPMRSIPRRHACAAAVAKTATVMTFSESLMPTPHYIGQHHVRSGERGGDQMRTRFSLMVCALLWLCAPAWCAEPLSAGAAFNLGFSPKGGAEAIILEAIGKAEKSIKVAAYSFTSKTIATALLAAHKRGVVVQVVADAKSNSGKYTAITFLANQGVPVRINSNYAIFHHKFIVFDGRNVQTGSFNFSAAAATKNAENVLLLWNVPELAAQYEREWQRLWDESTEVKPRY